MLPRSPLRAGLNILRHPIHGSGNPVPWDIDHGSEHSELLCMLHVKLGDYAHWAVRINRQTRRVTHLSAGPVVKARDYRNEVRSGAISSPQRAVQVEHAKRTHDRLGAAQDADTGEAVNCGHFSLL